MRIEVGQILKTNYETGPYRVLSITRRCTCKEPTDFFDEGPDMPQHLHMRLQDLRDGSKDSYLGWYDEETLTSVVPGCNDQLILCETTEPIQTSLSIV